MTVASVVTDEELYKSVRFEGNYVYNQTTVWDKFVAVI